MKRFLLAVAITGAIATPALASECPLLQKQMDAAVGNRLDAASATAKALAAEADALHKGGKHADSVKKYDEAAKAAGITLKHKQ